VPAMMTCSAVFGEAVLDLPAIDLERLLSGRGQVPGQHR